METEKRGYVSLKNELDYWSKREPNRAEEWKASFEWALARAQQYAEFCHTDRETVLSAWERKRNCWYVNFYKELNLPDLSSGKVMTLDDWEAEGKRRFGNDPLEWRFKCPSCGHVQTMRQFRDACLDPEWAYLHCASRHGLGGGKECKWTMRGLLKTGGRYVIDKSYVPHLVFDFSE